MTTSFRDTAKIKHEKISMHLKTIRKDENLTMRELAGTLDTPHSFIGKIENQQRRLDIAEFCLYCRAMNRDPTVVMAEIENLC